jgi:predicted DNA-binding protein YlxM (UPF0122 family)
LFFSLYENDLDHMSEAEVMKEIEQMVKVTREMYHDSNVVFTEILPRFYRDMNMLTQYNQKRRLFNNLLKDYCNDLELAIVNFGDYFDIDAKIFGIFRVKNHDFTPKNLIFSNCEGRCEIFGVFRVKNHDFTSKNHIFSNFRGGARLVRPPPPPPVK